MNSDGTGLQMQSPLEARPEQDEDPEMLHLDHQMALSVICGDSICWEKLAGESDESTQAASSICIAYVTKTVS